MREALYVIRRTGRTATKPPQVVNQDAVKDLARDQVIVKWFLSCGTVLTIGPSKGPSGKGELCDRVLEVERDEAAAKRRRRRKRDRGER